MMFWRKRQRQVIASDALSEKYDQPDGYVDIQDSLRSMGIIEEISHDDYDEDD